MNDPQYIGYESFAWDKASKVWQYCVSDAEFCNKKMCSYNILGNHMHWDKFIIKVVFPQILKNSCDFWHGELVDELYWLLTMRRWLLETGVKHGENWTERLCPATLIWCISVSVLIPSPGSFVPNIRFAAISCAHLQAWIRSIEDSPVNLVIWCPYWSHATQNISCLFRSTYIISFSRMSWAQVSLVNLGSLMPYSFSKNSQNTRA